MKRALSELNPKVQADNFRASRQREREDLKYKLEKAKSWAARLEKLKDNSVEDIVAARLLTLQAECLKQGLTFSKVKNSFTSYGREHNTIYTKDKVEIKSLYSELDVRADGTVCVDVYRIPAEYKDRYYYRPKASHKVIRIFVGEQTRVTNNVLRSLLGNHDKL